MAYAVHSARLLRAYKLFKIFIETLREKHDNIEIYIELEKTALDWQRKHLLFADNHKKKLHSLKEALAKEQGAKRKV